MKKKSSVEFQMSQFFLSISNSKYEFSVEIFLWNEIKLRFIFEIKMLIDKKSKYVFFNRLKKKRISIFCTMWGAVLKGIC